jgi:hypothetical protein
LHERLFVTVRMKPECRDLPAEWFAGQKAVVVRGTMIAPPAARYRWSSWPGARTS